MRPLPRDECMALSFASRGELLRYDLAPIQLGLGKCPWRVAVASIMMNRTRRAQAAPVLRAMLGRWPVPEKLVLVDHGLLAVVLRGTGFQNRRARTLLAFTHEWIGGRWTDMRDLPGVGAYVADAVGLFCFGDVQLASTDRALVEYAVQLRGTGVAPGNVVG